ncbi:hypothetical protein [Streptomyces sp. BE303]|nr:hypothetical protein [Streptomyces sp. BE303]MED7952798.1 hypothetical protein [Streptomyces sp. BE303]
MSAPAVRTAATIAAPAAALPGGRSTTKVWKASSGARTLSADR